MICLSCYIYPLLIMNENLIRTLHSFLFAFTLGNIEIPFSFSVPRCIKCSCRERGVCGTSLSAKSFLKVIPTPLRLFDQTKRDVISIQRLKCLSLSWFVTVDLSSNDSSWAILYLFSCFFSKMKPRQVKAGPGGQVWWATFNSFLFSAHTLRGGKTSVFQLNVG